MPLTGLTDHWVIKISFRVHMTQLSLPKYPKCTRLRIQGSNLFRTPELHIAMLLPAPPSAALGRRVVALGSAETTLIDPQTSCCSHVLRSIHCASYIPSTNFWQCQTCQTLDGEASARTFPSKLRWDWTFACLIGFSPLDQWNGCRMLLAWDVLKLDVWHKKQLSLRPLLRVKRCQNPSRSLALRPLFWPQYGYFGWFNWPTNWSSMVPLGSTNGIPYLFTDDHWFNWIFIPRSTNGHQWSHFSAKSAHFGRQPEDGISASGSHTVTPEVKALRFCKLRRWGLHPEFKPGMENDWSLTKEVSSNNETYYGKNPFFDKKFQTRYIPIPSIRWILGIIGDIIRQPSACTVTVDRCWMVLE